MEHQLSDSGSNNRSSDGEFEMLQLSTSSSDERSESASSIDVDNVITATESINSQGVMKAEEYEKARVATTVSMESVLPDKSLTEMGCTVNEPDTWNGSVEPRKKDLAKLLKHMVKYHIKPNVQVRIGEKIFLCHMQVLSSFSEIFNEHDTKHMIELPETSVTIKAFIMIYKWMISDRPLIKRENILELFIAAKFLRIKPLIHQCWICFDDPMGFTEDTAFLLYWEARKFEGLEDLKQLMLPRICRFFLTLVASKEYLELNINEIATLLRSNNIGVNSEMEVLMSAARWLNYNWPEREPDVMTLIKCVRFKLMPSMFLLALSKTGNGVELERITSRREIKDMVMDGLFYNTTLQYQKDSNLLATSLMERFWLYDEGCNNHHSFDCPNMQYVTYGSFLEYLDMIKDNPKQHWRNVKKTLDCENNKPCCKVSCLSKVE